MVNYHGELLRQQDQKKWPELAPSAKAALNILYRDKKIDIELELCEEPDNYVLKRYHEVNVHTRPTFLANSEEIFHVGECDAKR